MAGEVRYYTAEDAARMLRLSPERVREMLEDGELEAVRTGAMPTTSLASPASLLANPPT